MNTRRTPTTDPLVDRIQKVDALVRELRAERLRLQSEVERLGGEPARLGRELDAARRRAESLESARGTAYGRVQRLLESLGG